ncbi:MAG: PilZ domain-containing protein [Thermodesulfobacteriota bacterium]|nr:PilZ domain-containing protein [Thermodesulfobacteriota bacterium]
MVEDKRRFTRIPFTVKSEIRANNVLYCVEEFTNLSVGGCLVPITAQLDPGTECQVEVLLSGVSSELTLRVEGEVVRSQPEEVAIRFTRIDPDSLFHLQNIIRYNAQDPDKIEAEIQEHPGIV